MKSITPWFKRQLPMQRREEEHPFFSLQKEMNQLFDHFQRNFDMPDFAFGDNSFGDFNPRIDMKDSDKEITVTAELPGIEEKDVQLKVNGDVLIISGEKRSEKEEDVKGHYKMERIYGSFSRSLLLPQEVDLDKCTATFKNGVLNVVLPKTKVSERTSKTIPVMSH